MQVRVDGLQHLTGVNNNHKNKKQVSTINASGEVLQQTYEYLQKEHEIKVQEFMESKRRFNIWI